LKILPIPNNAGRQLACHRVGHFHAFGAVAWGSREANPELLMGDVQNVAMDQRRLVDFLAIDESAVAAAQVSNAKCPILLPDLHVFLGHLAGIDGPLRGAAAANKKRQRPEQNAMGRMAPPP